MIITKPGEKPIYTTKKRTPKRERALIAYQQGYMTRESLESSDPEFLKNYDSLTQLDKLIHDLPEELK